MRIDMVYLKEFLDIVLENDHPDFRIDRGKLSLLWTDDDMDNNEKLNKLVFHMEILEDQGLIENSTKLEGIGFHRFGNGTFHISPRPLRLTAQGHQFASDLIKPGVIELLTTEFKEAGPTDAVEFVFALGKKILNKKLGELID